MLLSSYIKKLKRKILFTLGGISFLFFLFFLVFYNLSYIFLDFYYIFNSKKLYANNSYVKNFLINKHIYSGNRGLVTDLNTNNDVYKNFSLGNSYVFSGLDYYFYSDLRKNTDFRKLYYNFSGAIYFYNKALNSTTGIWYKRIYQNKIKAENMAYLFGLKYCVDNFKIKFDKFSDVEDKMESVKKILLKLISLIKNKISTEKNSYLKYCLKKLLDSLSHSYVNLSDIKILLRTYKRNFIKIFYAKIKNVDNCISEENMFLGIDKGLARIFSGLDAYDSQYGKLYFILSYGSDEHLRMLCENSYVINNKFNKNNQRLSKGFQKLKEYLGNPKKYTQRQQGKGKKQSKNYGNSKKNGGLEQKNNPEGRGDIKNKNNKGKKQNNQIKGSGQKHHYHIDEDEVKKTMEEVIRRGYRRINQMETIKNNPNYNPEQVLNKLFREFYGNKEGFEYKKNLNGW